MRQFKASYALAGLFVLLDVVVGTNTVLAHDYRPTRQALVQVDDAGGAILWRIELKGHYAKLWRRAHLIQGAGGGEKTFSDGALLRLWAKAVDGVEFRVNDGPIKLSAAKMHLEENQEDKLVVLGLVTFSLAKNTIGNDLHVACALKKPGPKLQVRAQGLGQWALRNVLRPTKEEVLLETHVLQFEEHIAFKFVRNGA